MKKIDYIKKAINLAAVAHDGQYRKGSKVPYIVHPLEVYRILEEMKVLYSTMIAGILHDTIEDTPVTLDQIIEQFGSQVANLVADCSENKNLSWEERKIHTIDFLKTPAYSPAKSIIFADKLSNIRSLVDDYEVLNDDLWSRFNRGYDKQKWYYSELLNIFKDKFNNKLTNSLFSDFEECYNTLFKD